MSKPTISLVIPAYNEERHLRACLDTIARQTVLPNEVIVVDNNSTDCTAALAAKYPFVAVVQELEAGIVFARDRGFDAAHGTIIGRLDADDTLPDDWVETIKEFYADPLHGATVVTGSSVPQNMWFPRIGAWVGSAIIMPTTRIILGHYPLYGSNMALPRLVWEGVRDEVCRRADIHEDIDLAIHLHRLGYPIVYWPNFRVGVVIRRMRGESQTLWTNALMWPRTLQVHGNKRWPAAWCEAVLLMLSSVIVRGLDAGAHLLGKQPLTE